ncbi:hypothetical protein [uncultured Hymenobacter sp.]|uniref:hypothetical protein n=1 Tax=uncultured Hymenobacter sp. TaxID=170016 RepID=UPI0035CB8DFC
MKHLFNILPKLTAIAAIALSAASCNRAEYAMLPKTTPYHATYGTTKSVPTPTVAEKDVTVAKTQAAQPAEKLVAVEMPAVGTPASAATPLAAPKAQAKSARLKQDNKPAAHRLNLVQKMGVAKVLKQVDKATGKVQLKQRHETAATSKLEGKLRQGVILLLVGLLVGLLGSIGGVIGNVFAILGSILFLVGVILIILYLLDEL